MNMDLKNRLALNVVKDGSHLIWHGATTGSGRPRLVIDGEQIDARRAVYEDTYGRGLPRYTRFRSLCGRACVAPSCVSYRGDGQGPEDFMHLVCPKPSCGNRIGVLRSVLLPVVCSGRPGQTHDACVMAPRPALKFVTNTP